MAMAWCKAVVSPSFAHLQPRHRSDPFLVCPGDYPCVSDPIVEETESVQDPLYSTIGSLGRMLTVHVTGNTTGFVNLSYTSVLGKQLKELDMSTAHRRLRSPRSLSGTHTRQPHHGHISQYHGHEWMTHMLFVPCQPAVPFLR